MYNSLVFVKTAFSDRILHWIFGTIVILLVLTGFSQMFPSNSLSLRIFDIFGGVENARQAHHVCGFLFFVMILFTAGVVSYSAFVRGVQINSIPGLDDVREISRSFKYNLGMGPEKPSIGRALLAEKAIYWTLTWGSVTMLLSGFILLNPVAVARMVPGVVIPIAKLAHGYEALLLIIGQVSWHLYFLLMKDLKARVIALHPAEFKTIANLNPLQVVDAYDKRPPAKVSNRAMETYWRYRLPMRLLVSGVLIVSILYFINLDRAPILTVKQPEEGIAVYSPDKDANKPSDGILLASTLGGRQAIDPPISAIHSWDECINNLLVVNCIKCHGPETARDIHLKDYDKLMASGLIVPWDPDTSPMVAKISEHVSNGIIQPKLSETVRDWISSGAPKDGTLTPWKEMYRNETWVHDIKPIMEKNCISCHGADAKRGLDFRSYYSLMDSRTVVLGSPDESAILIKSGNYGHPGSLEPNDLLRLHEWVRYGARSGLTRDESMKEQLAAAVASIKEVLPSEAEGKVDASTLPPAWNSGVADLLASNCKGCHGAGGMGGFDVSTYDSVMNSGSVNARDPDGSTLITTMKSGDHAVSLAGQDLQRLVDWITTGAPLDPPASAGESL